MFAILVIGLALGVGLAFVWCFSGVTAWIEPDPRPAPPGA